MAEIGTDINKAAALLKSGNLVAIPTETVYGLAGNALDVEAVSRIFAVKNRPRFDPIIVHVTGLDQAAHHTTVIPEGAAALAEAFWPGPLTLLLKKNETIPDLVTDRKSTRLLQSRENLVCRLLLEKKKKKYKKQ